ncbi:MAG: GntR family transcriptional regulator [Pseudomonadota bacterium]
MTPPGTFDRVYAAIRQRLRDGLYRPGDRLEPALLSDELNASVTPVRDALHRLTGERLVEAPRHEGFRVPMMTESLLRYLYSWHLDLLLLAVLKKQSAAFADDMITGVHGDAPVHERQNILFLALARTAGNPEHLAALEALSYRLEPVQRLEQCFLDETEAETNDILAALKARDRRGLRNSLVRYHRRRERVVPQLLAALFEGKTNAL